MTDYRHDIEKYLKGELTPTERNALERKALHDPFLADALDGAEQIKVKDFLKDVDALNEKVAGKKIITVWIWPARIAAGLAIIALSSYIVWTVMKPEVAQELAFEKSEPAVTPSAAADSVSPETGTLSSPPVEKSGAGPTMLDKDVATRSGAPSKTETRPTGSSGQAKPTQGAAGESIVKNEPIADDIVAGAEQAKEEEIKADEIAASKSVAQTVEKEAEILRSKASDDLERKAAKKKDAAPAAADRSEAGLASTVLQNAIQGKVTSAEDGSAIPGVNVIIKGTTVGTVTNELGNYEVTVATSNPTLVYSFIGLRSTEVKADRQEVNVQMAMDVAQLSEVVTVGYGVQSGESYPPTVDLAHPEIGNKAFKQYLEKNIRYPEQAKDIKTEGRVTVQFAVEANGTLTNFIIVRGIGSGCDEELIRLIKEGPKWIPTKKDNVAVQDKVNVRLKFELPK